MTDFSLPGGKKPSPLEVIRHFLAQAIGIGAPAYNAGDHRGCYEVYACTARLMLHAVDGAEDSKKAIRRALEQASIVPDVNEQAWIMRRAFDSILGKDSN